MPLRERPRAPEPEPPPVAVAFIPERRGLKPLVVRLAHSARAYPLFEVANLFLSKPDFYAVKIEARDNAAGQESVSLHQCGECKAAFLDRTQAVSHAFQKHGDQFYAREETRSEPPQGAFRCVARCPLSGELLGPPNYHAFADRLQDLHASRFASMPLDAYRRQLVNETDPALIERWKQQACIQTVYRTLRAEPAQTFTRRAQAESHFQDHYADGMVRAGRRVIVPGSVCQTLEDEALRRLIEAARAYESRFPLRLAFSIQSAFRHLGLHMFKHGSKETFVTAIVPNPIEPDRTDAGIRRILETIEAHPGVKRQELASILNPEAAPDNPDAPPLLQTLRWLVGKGHIIEFFNGTLILPPRRSEPEADSPPAKPAGTPDPTGGKP